MLEVQSISPAHRTAHYWQAPAPAMTALKFTVLVLNSFQILPKAVFTEHRKILYPLPVISSQDVHQCQVLMQRSQSQTTIINSTSGSRQSVKDRLCKHEILNSDPQHPVKCQVQQWAYVTLSLGRQNTSAELTGQSICESPLVFSQFFP